MDFLRLSEINQIVIGAFGLINGTGIEHHALVLVHVGVLPCDLGGDLHPLALFQGAG